MDKLIKELLLDAKRELLVEREQNDSAIYEEAVKGTEGTINEIWNNIIKEWKSEDLTSELNTCIRVLPPQDVEVEFSEFINRDEVINARKKLKMAYSFNSRHEEQILFRSKGRLLIPILSTGIKDIRNDGIDLNIDGTMYKFSIPVEELEKMIMQLEDEPKTK